MNSTIFKNIYFVGEFIINSSSQYGILQQLVQKQYKAN